MRIIRLLSICCLNIVALSQFSTAMSENAADSSNSHNQLLEEHVIWSTYQLPTGVNYDLLLENHNSAKSYGLLDLSDDTDDAFTADQERYRQFIIDIIDKCNLDENNIATKGNLTKEDISNTFSMMFDPDHEQQKHLSPIHMRAFFFIRPSGKERA
ncbi:MAG: hypothetical protein NTX76_02525 [Alphaproteobacteria bacterium]|nr:hypothetical protein [Alphaproteobacteria bacterium]